MCVKIHVNLENSASEEIYALLINAFLSISRLSNIFLLLNDCRYISILGSVSPYGSSLFSGKHRVSLTLSRLLCCVVPRIERLCFSGCWQRICRLEVTKQSHHCANVRTCENQLRNDHLPLCRTNIV